MKDTWYGTVGFILSYSCSTYEKNVWPEEDLIQSEYYYNTRRRIFDTICWMCGQNWPCDVERAHSVWDSIGTLKSTLVLCGRVRRLLWNKIISLVRTLWSDSCSDSTYSTHSMRYTVSCLGEWGVFEFMFRHGTERRGCCGSRNNNV